ncbi:MAG: hypothetical protein HF975_16645 [ANME-2 cluster archaeon]|nr:hypothetical protein [ANME-2 cluster archaeon]MBC2748592.1 hypothetical protein [ANME-2 cluster archaeon]
MDSLFVNVYLHYALDLWFETEVIPQLTGYAQLVRYADDFVVCFEKEEEARAFGIALRQRMGEFGLTISEEKSKIIEFGRCTCQRARKYGIKCETFDSMEKTLKFHQEIYNSNGILIEIHQKYPEDAGHRKIRDESYDNHS